MKTAFKYLSAMVMLITIPLNFTSCGGDDGESSGNNFLVGVWEGDYYEDGYSIHISYEFRKNMTGYSTTGSNTMFFKYTYSEDYITLEYPKTSVYEDWSEYVRLEIISRSGGEMVIYHDGQSVTLRRTGEASGGGDNNGNGGGSEVEADDPSLIIGTWYSSTPNVGYEKYVFYSDGTGLQYSSGTSRNMSWQLHISASGQIFMLTIGAESYNGSTIPISYGVEYITAGEMLLTYKNKEYLYTKSY